MRKHRLVVLFCSEQLAELKRSIDHELRQRDEDTNVVRNNVGATDHRHAVQPCRALINACHVLTGIAARALPPAQLDSRGSRCGRRGWLCGSSVRDGGKCVCGSSRAIDERDEATGCWTRQQVSLHHRTSERTTAWMLCAEAQGDRRPLLESQLSTRQGARPAREGLCRPFFGRVTTAPVRCCHLRARALSVMCR